MKKIFFLVLCLSVLVSSFAIPTSASTLFVPPYTEQVSINGQYTQHIIYRKNDIVSGNNYYLAVFYAFDTIYGKMYPILNSSSVSSNRQINGSITLSVDMVDIGYQEHYRLGMKTYQMIGDGINGSWDLIDSVNHFNDIGSYTEIIYGSFDIYDMSTGNLFFQQTLPLSMVVGEGLIQMQAQTTRTILTLTVCGVGLVAFLVLFLLLTKKFQIFLLR